MDSVLGKGETMKKFSCLAIATALGMLAGCSTSPSDSSSWGTVSEEQSTVNTPECRGCALASCSI